MATLSTDPRTTTITLATDTAGPFNLSFRLFDTDTIQVYVNNLPRVDFTLSVTFTDGFDDGATITFDESLTSGDVIIIDSDLTPQRQENYLNGPGLVELMNIELGRIWAAIADTRRDSKRSLKTFENMIPSSLRPSELVVVNAAGDGLLSQPFDYGEEVSLAYKRPVRVATTVQITLAGLQVIDDVSLAAGDRVLVKTQTNQIENGIYVVADGGWSRALDFSGALDVVLGTRVYVTSGTSLGGTVFVLDTADPVIGISNLVFSNVFNTALAYSSEAQFVAADLSSQDSGEVVFVEGKPHIKVAGAVSGTGGSIKDGWEPLRSFRTVADLIASRQLGGDTGSTWQAGTYRYSEAASDATDHHVTTAGGVKLYVTPAAGIYDIEAWGSPVTSAIFNGAMDDIGNLAAEVVDNFNPVLTVKCSSKLETSEQLTVSYNSGSRILGVNVDLSEMYIVSQSGGTLTATDPVLVIKARDVDIKSAYIDCNRVSSGVLFDGCLNSNIDVGFVTRYPTPGETVFGVKVDGANSNARFIGGWSIQWDANDAEFPNLSNFTGRAFWFEGVDYKVANIFGGRCGVPIYIGTTVSLVYFHNIHPYNGNPTTPRTDPALVENYSNGPVYIQDSYMDNGIVHDYSAELRMSDCHMFELPDNVTLTDPEVRVYASAATDGTDPVGTRFRNNNAMSVGYFSDPTDTYHWAGDYSQLSFFYDEMNLRSVHTSTSQRDIRVFTRSDNVPYEQNFRPGGLYRREYHTVNGGSLRSLYVEYDPVKSLITTDAERLELDGWQIHGAPTELTISGGSITPTRQFHTVDTEGDAATDVLNTIATTGIPDGTILTLSTAVNNRDITIEHNTGNIFCGSDRTLSITADVIVLMKVGTFWRMLSFADNL